MKIKAYYPAAIFLMLALSHSSYARFHSTKWAVHVTNFTGEITDKPHQGFTTLIYPIKIISGPTRTKFYYSQYVSFTHARDREAYYMGLQPNSSGKASVLFSVFGQGVRPIDNNCTGEADGGDGSSCIKVIRGFKFNKTYRFIATLEGHTSKENTWAGYVIDAATGVKTRIGSWATPTSWGYMSGKSIGFIEAFVGIKSCNEIPATSAWLGSGVGKTDSGIAYYGKMNRAYGTGVCNGKVPFSSRVDERDGLTIIQSQGID